ncbi:hypothetical protein AAFF_G00056690 [Aldrovandia affinis]|uniref:Uncharacterized protein n=1 Tax=Aldrovandia affinis TaxID=143900 RepID=A0AAD7S0L6_9TELE|nr:hypothetical protein AAFF_G00056690 [Aldrovandia affinis]
MDMSAVQPHGDRHGAGSPEGAVKTDRPHHQNGRSRTLGWDNVRVRTNTCRPDLTHRGRRKQGRPRGKASRDDLESQLQWINTSPRTEVCVASRSLTTGSCLRTRDDKWQPVLNATEEPQRTSPRWASNAHIV